MKNTKLNIEQTLQNAKKNQLIKGLTAKTIKGGNANSCPPPYGTSAP